MSNNNLYSKIHLSSQTHYAYASSFFLPGKIVGESHGVFYDLSCCR